jgi:hypothetical protein
VSVLICVVEAIKQVVMLNFLSFINLCIKKGKKEKKDHHVLTLVKGWRFRR